MLATHHRRTGRLRAEFFLAAALGVLPAGFAADNLLYWTAVNDYPHYTIRRSNLDGSNVEDIVPDDFEDLTGLAIDGGASKLYWIERGIVHNRILRAELDGSDIQTVLDLDTSASHIVLDPPRKTIYITVAGLSGYGIRRTGYAGGDLVPIVERDVYDLAVDSAGSRIYWVQEGPQGVNGTDIWSGDLDGEDQQFVVHHDFEHHTTGITLDTAAGKIYWATVDYRTTRSQIVKRANLDGSDIEDVTTANPGLDDWPVFLDLDIASRTLYWVNGEDGKFFRVAFDGGEAEGLFEDTGDFGPFGLVILQGDEVPVGPPGFRRGDADGNGVLEVTDPIFMLGALFLGTGTLPCEDAADVNDDEEADITDAVASLTYQFLGAFDIPAPGPLTCGRDARIGGKLGCASYTTCGP